MRGIQEHNENRISISYDTYDKLKLKGTIDNDNEIVFNGMVFVFSEIRQDTKRMFFDKKVV